MDILSEYEHSLTNQSSMIKYFLLQNQRGQFVCERDYKNKGVRSPKNPPQLPPFRSTFFEDVYMNLLCNARRNEYKGFIKHGECAKLICLKREFCAEDALVEMLSPEPSFYKRGFKKMKRSKYTDNSKENWGPLPTLCKTSLTYHVDFAIILPENLFSTVIVTCMECGRLFETIFCDSTKEVIKRDVLYNVSQVGNTRDSYEEESQKKNRENGTDVIRLQTRFTSAKGCSLAEGLIGIRLLTTAKVYARCRLTMYCSRSTSPLGFLLHDQFVDPGLFPTYEELLNIYKLDQR